MLFHELNYWLMLSMIKQCFIPILLIYIESTSPWYGRKMIKTIHIHTFIIESLVRSSLISISTHSLKTVNLVRQSHYWLWRWIDLRLSSFENIWKGRLQNSKSLCKAFTTVSICLFILFLHCTNPYRIRALRN